MSISSQIIKRKRCGETVKFGLRPGTDVFNNEDKGSEDEDFTTATSETVDKKSTKDSEDEKKFLVTLNCILEDFPSEDKEKALEEKYKGRTSNKI